MRFAYSNPTQLLFGLGQIANITSLIPDAGKTLLVYGGGSIKRNGAYEQIAQALQGREWLEFGGVEPNPRVETLDKGVALAKEQGVSFILAAGGGSVIDGAKYIAAAALYDGDGWDFPTGRTPIERALPLGAVVTLAATGSESNFVAVVSKESLQEKRTFRAPALQPRFAVLDPSFLSTLPDRQLANGLVDAFIHVCEQYLTFPAGLPIQDGYAETLLRALKDLAESFDQRRTLAWAETLMWAANQSFNGLIGLAAPQDWATHRISLDLTALYGVDHGRALSCLQPSLLRETLQAKADKLRQMGARVFDLPQTADLPERCIKAIEGMYRGLGMPLNLREAGVTDADALERLLAALEKRGMTALGEHGDITLTRSRAILERARG